jgi:nitrite reductase/ring-hydroxylating ferredoxin subunit
MGGTLVFRNQIAVDHRYADAGTWRVDAVPEHDIETGVIDVGADDELEVDQMKLLRVGSRRIVLARTEHGYAAFDDRCTHKGGPLADGSLVCDTVQCPWHGSQFDVNTGAVKHGPARKPVGTYAVKRRNGRLWLHL